MTLLMAAAAVYGVLQLVLLSIPTRTVRTTTVLLTLVVGIYGCGVATALAEIAYNRAIMESSGESWLSVVKSTSYTVAPWVEELIKVTPLLLAGLSLKVRLQWGLTDYVVLGAALGSGFGLLESVLRFGLDAERAVPNRGGGWIIPQGIFAAPHIPGLEQVLTSWFPAPSGQLRLGAGAEYTATSPHLVWTTLGGLGVGLLWRGRRWTRLLSLPPVAAAIALHTLNNYVAEERSDRNAASLLKDLNEQIWLAPLACLAVAAAVDWIHARRIRPSFPDVQLPAERTGRTGPSALSAYAGWCVPWSTLIALRFARLRRSLYYAARDTDPSRIEPLRRAVAGIRTRIEATDHEVAWQGRETLHRMKAARATPEQRRHRWLLLIPCVLMLPGVLFLGIGSFHSAAGIQEFFGSRTGTRVLMGFGSAALVWVGWQLFCLLRSWRATGAQPSAELLAIHRLRFGSALGSATVGLLMLYRGLGSAGPEGKSIPPHHLLQALDTFLVYLGFGLLLLSLLALFAPGAGLALAGANAVGALTAEAALEASLLGTAGIALMAAGANGSPGPEQGSAESTASEGQRRSTDPTVSDAVGSAREQTVADLTEGTIPSGAPGKPGLKVTKPGAGTTDVDVIGKDGSYIAVGGPAKARNLAKFGEKCHILKYAAEQQGVRAQVYLEEGTPETALNLARRILGNDNVHTFVR
ncbi:PrsW family intramembrane metalloprotease [Streptomyces triticagri]|uniref:PrsW family intramembrane metalloprotease n=1 Tax=Streptomyces triticagri TaxID=2293568 RepID=A0A372LXI8_9ACTN|nr:PrsW family glutamic-type intramembrane protease [Streptomyces triticagri]RFU83259.1 PrsW family intramembrane metalloprotease [Streptomyces triticagri]